MAIYLVQSQIANSYIIIILEAWSGKTSVYLNRTSFNFRKEVFLRIFL